MLLVMTVVVMALLRLGGSRRRVMRIRLVLSLHLGLPESEADPVGLPMNVTRFTIISSSSARVSSMGLLARAPDRQLYQRQQFCIHQGHIHGNEYLCPDDAEWR